jgi:hypothetical protein
MTDDSRPLPIRTGGVKLNEPSVRIHPLAPSACGEKDSLIISIETPQLPVGGLRRTNCDIVLVIDVSASMSGSAPLPDVQDHNEKEAAGLTILDLTKHAARTILETLKDGDRLGIVTFSDDARVTTSTIFRRQLEEDDSNVSRLFKA